MICAMKNLAQREFPLTKSSGRWATNREGAHTIGMTHCDAGSKKRDLKFAKLRGMLVLIKQTDRSDLSLKV